MGSVTGNNWQLGWASTNRVPGKHESASALQALRQSLVPSVAEFMGLQHSVFFPKKFIQRSVAACEVTAPPVWCWYPHPMAHGVNSAFRRFGTEEHFGLFSLNV